MTDQHLPPFDPIVLLSAMERHRVAYVLVGALARVIHGTDEITGEIEICPAMRADNLQRLARSFRELRVVDGNGQVIDADIAMPDPTNVRVTTPSGDIVITSAPVGSNGYDDLRRKATREAIGSGIRVPVPDPVDLARIVSAAPPSDGRQVASILRRMAEVYRGREL